MEYYTVEPLHQNTSVYSRESPPSRGCKIYTRANIHIIFLSVTSVEGTPLFRGKGHFFLVLNPRFYLHSGDTLVLRMWLTTKRVDKSKCTMITMIAAFTTWTIIISLKLKLMYCTCRNNSATISQRNVTCVTALITAVGSRT